MAYKGGVPVNSGFYPRNDFPIVEAKDVYVSDEQRLDAAIEELRQGISNKVDDSHNHDDKYYTELEIDTKLSEINESIGNITSGEVVVKKAESATTATTADSATNATNATNATKATQDASGNVITATYETKTDATAKLEAAKEYTDEKVSGLVSASIVDDKISAHNASDTAHSDIRDVLAEVKADVDAFFKDATISTEAKDTLKEIQNYITSDASAAAEMTSSIGANTSRISALETKVGDGFEEITSAEIQALFNA